MSRLRLPTMINFAVLCLIFFPFVQPREAPSGPKQPDGTPWFTARTMRGAGLERNVELVCIHHIAFKGMHLSIGTSSRPYLYGHIRYMHLTLIQVSVDLFE
jgi:hypothetical protein